MADTFVDHRDEPDNVAMDEARALRAWHAAHSAWLHAFLCRALRLQPSDVDDIVQDTWLRVIRTSLAEIEHPRAFLSRVALNLFRDRHRRNAVRTAHLHLVARKETARVDIAALSEQECALELERAILDLPANIRDVFVLSRFRRMTNKDIAAHFGVSIKTVEWRIGKAIELCASRLRD